jgi:hypothetical protein
MSVSAMARPHPLIPPTLRSARARHRAGVKPARLSAIAWTSVGVAVGVVVGVDVGMLVGMNVALLGVLVGVDVGVVVGVNVTLPSVAVGA